MPGFVLWNHHEREVNGGKGGLKENKDKEIRGLLDAMDAYSLKESFIITEDQDDEIMVGSLKILIRPLWKWLLGF